MSIARLTVGILLYDDITCVAANFSIHGAILEAGHVNYHVMKL